jgi:hypothetical protein
MSEYARLQHLEDAIGHLLHITRLTHSTDEVFADPEATSRQRQVEDHIAAADAHVAAAKQLAVEAEAAPTDVTSSGGVVLPTPNQT